MAKTHVFEIWLGKSCQNNKAGVEYFRKYPSGTFKFISLLIWLILGVRNLCWSFLVGFLVRWSFTKIQVLDILGLYATDRVVCWLDLDILVIFAWDVTFDILFWAFLRFPWPVEVFLSDDHLPKYKVCNISVCDDYITAADAMYSTWGASHPILCLEQRGPNVFQCNRLFGVLWSFNRENLSARSTEFSENAPWPKKGL